MSESIQIFSWLLLTTKWMNVPSFAKIGRKEMHDDILTIVIRFMGGYYRTFLFFCFFRWLPLGFYEKPIRSVTLFSFPKSWWKKFRKKIFRLAVTWPQKCGSNPPYKSNYYSQNVIIHFPLSDFRETRYVHSFCC